MDHKKTDAVRWVVSMSEYNLMHGRDTHFLNHTPRMCTMPVIYELQKHTEHSDYLIDGSQITFYKHKACSVYVAHETSSLWAFSYPCSSSSSLSPDNIFNTLSLFAAVGAVWPQ